MNVSSVSPVQLFNLPLTEFYLVLDTRSPSEFDAGHIVSAWNVPLKGSEPEDEVDARAMAMLTHIMDENPPERKDLVFVYGQDDADPTADVLCRSLAARTFGMKTVGRLSGGFDGFKALFPRLCEAGLEFSDVPPLPAIILPGLYLGSKVHASHEALLKEWLGVNAVANISNELPHYFESDPEMKYHREPVEDNVREDMEEAFTTGPAFIRDELKRDGRTVLVHCAQGKSRSVSVVVAFLLRYGSEFAGSATESGAGAGAGAGSGSGKPGLTMSGCALPSEWTAESALEYVRSCRPGARPNDSFVRQLRKLDSKLNDPPSSDTKEEDGEEGDEP